MAFGWIGATSAFGSVVRKPKTSQSIETLGQPYEVAVVALPKRHRRATPFGPFLALLDCARGLFDARQTEIRHFAGVGSRHPDRDEPRFSQILGIEATSVVLANFDVHDHQIVFTRQYSLQFFRSEDTPDDLARRVAERSIVLGLRGEGTPSSAEAASAGHAQSGIVPDFGDLVFAREGDRKGVRPLNVGRLRR